MKPRIALFALVGLLAAMLVACGDSGSDSLPTITTRADDPTTTTSPTDTTGPTDTTVPVTVTSLEGTSTTTTVVETTTTTEANVVDISIIIDGDDVQGGGEIEVPLGSIVRLLVSGDAEDEVHIHGYDLFADIAPDEAVLFEFEADIAGIFEVELEDSGLLLAELVVAP